MTGSDFLTEIAARRFLNRGLLKFPKMNGKVLALTIVAVIISFIGGFMLANSLNRNELNSLRAANEQLKNTTPQAEQNSNGSTLSDGEIRQKIAEADKNPTNFAYQKSLGLALYTYAMMKQDVDLLAEVNRILSRANELNKDDYDIIVALGNTNFDIGYYKKENAPFEKAREFYNTALQKKPEDVDVRTDLGLTYFLSEPSEYEQAINQFQKSLQTNPKHEKTLQVLAQTYLKQNNAVEAEKYLARLKEVNSNNQYLPDLETRLSQIKGTSQK